MADTGRNQTSWWTVVWSALFAAALSLGISYCITGHTFRLNQEAQMERARNYADKLEIRLEVELTRNWADYRQDSVKWLSDKADSLRDDKGRLSAQGRDSNLAAVSESEKRVNQYFRELIEATREQIIRYETDERLEIETIRETGVLLK